MTDANPQSGSIHARDRREFQEGIVDRSSEARIYDYFLGGSLNSPIDRIKAAHILSIDPRAAVRARAHRAFQILAVQHMLDHGIRQFVDLGSGVPTCGSTHNVAQRQFPDAQVVYVDHEPAVVDMCEVILAGEPTVTIIGADLRDPSTVLYDATASGLIDLDQPLGLVAINVLHTLSHLDAPAAVLASYIDALAPASQLALSISVTPTREPLDEAQLAFELRRRNTLASWLTGLHPIGQGIAPLSDWLRPDAAGAENDIATIGLRAPNT